MPAKRYADCTPQEKERRKANSRNWYAKNKEKIQQKEKIRRQENRDKWPSCAPEKMLQRSRESRARHRDDPEWRERRLAVRREWDAKNRRENHETVRAYYNAWYRRNREKVLGYQKNMTTEQREARNARQRESLRSNPDRAARDKQSRIKKRAWMKEEVIDKYGGHCACCGEDNLAFLTIDHVNGDGGKWRRENSKIATEIYRILLREKDCRDDLQVLCYNCNIAKHHFGACPHQSCAKFIVESGLVPTATT